MKNSQKGSTSVILLIIIIVILLVAVGYMYLKKPVTSNQVSDNSQNTTNTPPVDNTKNSPSSLTEKDILTAIYEISADFSGAKTGGTKTAPQKITFPVHIGNDNSLTGVIWIDKSGKVTTTVPASDAEAFWIYKYEFTDSLRIQAKVYIGGNFGASAQDDRVYTAKKVNGMVVTEEING